MGKRVKTKLGRTLAYAATKAFMSLVDSSELCVASDIDAHGVRFADKGCGSAALGAYNSKTSHDY